jgi:hypothetical protein
MMVAQHHRQQKSDYNAARGLACCRVDASHKKKLVVNSSILHTKLWLVGYFIK